MSKRNKRKGCVCGGILEFGLVGAAIAAFVYLKGCFRKRKCSLSTPCECHKKDDLNEQSH